MTGTVSEFIPGGADTGNLSITQISDFGAELSSTDPVFGQRSAGRGSDHRGEWPQPAADRSVVISAERTAGEPAGPIRAPSTPDVDGIDFYESLEGMLVTIDDPVVIAPTNRFDETWVLSDDGNFVTSGETRA